MTQPKAIEFLLELRTLNLTTYNQEQFLDNVISAVESSDGTFESQEIYNCFVEAARLGLTKVVQLFLVANKNLIDVVNDVGYTALTIAYEYWHQETFDFLLENGADVKKRGAYATTALHCAARYGHQKAVETLIIANVNVDAVDDIGDTAILVAARSGHKEVVKRLIAANADVNKADLSLITPLFFAVTNEEIVKQLLVAGAVVDQAEDRGWTPLHIAAYRNVEKVTKLLIKFGADIERIDKSGETPLAKAVSRHYKSRAAVPLLYAGAQINKQMFESAASCTIPILLDTLQKRNCAKVLEFCIATVSLKLPVLLVVTLLEQVLCIDNNTPQYAKAWQVAKHIKQMKQK